MLPNIRVLADPLQNAWHWYFRYSFNFQFYSPKRPLLPAALQEALMTCSSEASELALFLEWRTEKGDSEELVAAQQTIQAEFDVKHEEIFKRMFEMTGLMPYLPRYTCYLTTHPGSPYDVECGCMWMFTKLDYPGRVGVFLHEYQHMLVHHYFEQSIVTQVKKEGFQHIKEALTTLLNHWFDESFMGRSDLGYPMHALLRSEIDEAWQQTGDFQKVIEHAVRVYPQFAKYHSLRQDKEK